MKKIGQEKNNNKFNVKKFHKTICQNWKLFSMKQLYIQHFI